MDGRVLSSFSRRCLGSSIGGSWIRICCLAKMKAYIALGLELALRVDAENMLTARMIGPHCHYIPLKETPQQAVDSAVLGTAIHGRVAVEEVVWIILEIGFEDEQLLELFQTEKISRNAAKGGWQWYGNLNYREYRHKFHQGKTEPIGIEDWANKVLVPRYTAKVASVCDECAQMCAMTWTAKKDFNYRNYCARCWHSFYYRAFQDSMIEDAK